MKKFILLMTMTALCCGICFAQNAGDFRTRVTNGAVTITGYNRNVSGELVIPADINGLPVTEIGRWAFRGYSSLTTITIPSSVTAIGRSAFDGCSSLTTITVDNRNSRYASMDGVLFDKNMQTIITYPAGKRGLAYTIPSSVTAIEESAFRGCSNLMGVAIPSSVTAIEDSAFFSCSSLTSVTIPSSVTTIGGSAFGGCFSLTSVTIPSSVTAIGMMAFGDCRSLTTVTIPSSVTAIGDSAFYGCNLDAATRSEITSRFGNAPFEK